MVTETHWDRRRKYITVTCLSCSERVKHKWDTGCIVTFACVCGGSGVHVNGWPEFRAAELAALRSQPQKDMLPWCGEAWLGASSCRANPWGPKHQCRETPGHESEHRCVCDTYEPVEGTPLW